VPWGNEQVQPLTIRNLVGFFLGFKGVYLDRSQHLGPRRSVVEKAPDLGPPNHPDGAGRGGTSPESRCQLCLILRDFSREKSLDRVVPWCRLQASNLFFATFRHWPETASVLY
jgi:hypothetical protein